MTTARRSRSRRTRTAQRTRAPDDDRPRPPTDDDDPFRVCRSCGTWGFRDLDYEPGRRVCRSCKSAADLERYHGRKAQAA